MSKCRLFCLPYAGGSARLFSDWQSFLSPNIEVIPLELNGRGRLIGKPLYESVRDASQDILHNLRPYLESDIPYCFFGQSLGGLIVYDMLEVIHRRNYQFPLHIFFSAIFPPHVNKIRTKLHELSDEDFLRKLKRWSSLPPSVTEDPEMLRIWMPVLKADYKLLENYHFQPVLFHLPIDFTILKGKLDDWLTREEYCEWERYTDRKLEFHEIDGGHLFIQEEKQKVMTLVKDTLGGYF